MKRRSFLKVLGSAAGGCVLGMQTSGCRTAEQSLASPPSREAGLQRRVLGRTGERISIVGFPGLGLVHDDQEICTRALHQAFEQGVNYYDVAPAYGNGDAEIKMGIGLQGIDRSRVFLACKTKMRDKKGARAELERSLKRLKTDHFDLYQMHAIFTPEEVQEALGPGGAMETFLEAKKEGKVRYFGFSAHTTKGALAAMSGYRFDTVMFPINYVEMFKMRFGRAVLDLAAQQGAGVLAIKPMCGGGWPEGAERTRRWWYRPLEEQSEIDMALRFTLSQKPVVAGLPPAFLDLADKAIQVGRSYHPITEAESRRLREMAESAPSVFKREEEKVARGGACPVMYPDSPHECCPGTFA